MRHVDDAGIVAIMDGQLTQEPSVSHCRPSNLYSLLRRHEDFGERPSSGIKSARRRML